MRKTVDHDDFMRERLADSTFAAEYLQAAIDDGDTAVLLLALRRIVEARGGMTQLARDTGLAREALYRTLSNGGNPRLTSLRAILDASGLRLTIAPAVETRSKTRKAIPHVLKRRKHAPKVSTAKVESSRIAKRP